MTSNPTKKRKHTMNPDINRRLMIPASLSPKTLGPEPTLESLDVSLEQCTKAVTALLAHASKRVKEKEAKQLIQADETVELVVTLKQIPSHAKTMPIRLPIPHAIIDPKQSPVCLLTKDPQREYKDLLTEKKISFIARVVGVTKLKGKFKPYEARRQLMNENDFFLADDRIIPMLPKLLGEKWTSSKKTPVPVCLTRVDLKAELERALLATYLYIGRGACLSIKLGILDRHTKEQLLANLKAVLPQLAVRLPMGGWTNVQSLHIKTTTSTSLPIWAAPLTDAAPGESGSGAGRFYTAPSAKAVGEDKADGSPPKRKRETDEKRSTKRRKASDGEAVKANNKKVKKLV